LEPSGGARLSGEIGQGRRKNLASCLTRQIIDGIMIPLMFFDIYLEGVRLVDITFAEE
jgi:hypothetical protein